MKISELGQFRLIDLVNEMVNKSRNEESASWQNLIIGIGDDTAAWRCDDTTQLAKVDCQVQNVHFSFDYVTWEELGWKALAVNLSDIAAMGGFPRYALVSLGLPPDTEVDDVTDLYRGMLKLAKSSGTAVIGGNMSGSAVVFVDVTVIGSTGDKNGSMLLRSSVKPGDKVAVTGYVGTAAAGLDMLRKKMRFDAETTNILRIGFARPVPRLAEGRLLIESGVKAAIDISDGLLADLGHICESSRVGADVYIENVPVHPKVRESFGDKALELALSGGEDYELLFTASREIIEKVKQSARCPVTVIGEIVAAPGKITLVDGKGNRFSPGKTGWDHFKV